MRFGNFQIEYKDFVPDMAYNNTAWVGLPTVKQLMSDLEDNQSPAVIGSEIGGGILGHELGRNFFYHHNVEGELRKDVIKDKYLLDLKDINPADPDKEKKTQLLKKKFITDTARMSRANDMIAGVAAGTAAAVGVGAGRELGRGVGMLFPDHPISKVPTKLMEAAQNLSLEDKTTGFRRSGGRYAKFGIPAAIGTVAGIGGLVWGGMAGHKRSQDELEEIDRYYDGEERDEKLRNYDSLGNKTKRLAGTVADTALKVGALGGIGYLGGHAVSGLRNLSGFLPRKKL